MKLRPPSATWLPPLLLFAAAFALFAPSIRYSLVNLDDQTFILNNPIVFNGFSWQALGRAFTGLHGDKTMYSPLLWVSYLLDSLLFGATPERPWGYHLGNILLHAANAVLLYFIVREAVRRPALAFGAALLWAVHPLRVESVAWVTERKDTLSTLFAFASTFAYLRACRPTAPRPRLAATASFLFYAAGLLAKPMLVTLPFLFLLLDIWPLRRLALHNASHALPRLLLGKWPHFLLAAAFSFLTYRLQTGAIVRIPLALRLARLPSNYFFYFSRTLWPSGLCPLAPGPPATLPWLLASCAFFTILAAGAALLLRRAPGVATGLLAFGGLLFPVSGIIFIGTVPVADRYSYLPSIGLALALAALADTSVPRRPSARLATALAALTLAAASALAAVTLHILPAWKDPQAFARRAGRIVPNHALALMERFSDAFFQQGDLPAATAAANAIWTQKPGDAFSVLAQLFVRGQTDPADAIAFFAAHPPLQASLETLDSLHLALAILYTDTDDPDRALPLLDTLLANHARHPKYAEVVTAVAIWAFDRLGHRDRASALARQHPGMDPTHPLSPENRLLCASSLLNLGFRRQAFPLLRQIARDAPDNPALLNNIAWLLATTPHSPADPTEPLVLAQRALTLAPDNPLFRDTCAVALAFNGQFSEALRIEEPLAAQLRLSTAADAPRLLAAIEKRIHLFRRHLPYTENASSTLLSYALR